MTKFFAALIVEDESHLAEALGISLQKFGVTKVSYATTLAEARSQDLKSFNLVLLDRMLPDGDGLDFCVHLRRENFGGAILVLTANGLVDERVRGLNAGADDYLAKPFSWPELAARLSAIERRLPETAAAAVQAESALWTLEPERMRVFGPKGWVVLTPLEFKFLKKLVDKENQIVSREELLKDVWGFQWLPKTRTVDHFLGRLRKRLEPIPAHPEHFLSVRGAGIQFCR